MKRVIIRASSESVHRNQLLGEWSEYYRWATQEDMNRYTRATQYDINEYPEFIPKSAGLKFLGWIIGKTPKIRKLLDLYDFVPLMQDEGGTCIVTTSGYNGHVFTTYFEDLENYFAPDYDD